MTPQAIIPTLLLLLLLLLCIGLAGRPGVQRDAAGKAVCATASHHHHSAQAHDSGHSPSRFVHA
jgi:hypothetical protein